MGAPKKSCPGAPHTLKTALPTEMKYTKRVFLPGQMTEEEETNALNLN